MVCHEVQQQKQLTHEDEIDGSEFPSEGLFRIRTRFDVVDSSAFIGENEYLDRSVLSWCLLCFGAVIDGLFTSSKSNCHEKSYIQYTTKYLNLHFRSHKRTGSSHEYALIDNPGQLRREELIVINKTWKVKLS